MAASMEPRAIALHALAGIGALVLAGVILRLLSFVYRHGFRPASRVLSSYRGGWAVITGASYGLGAAFARECARRGLNVVLIARSADKLQGVAAECGQRYGVASRAIAFDFADATDEQWRRLVEVDLAGLAPSDGDDDDGIRVLINNVGVNVEYPTDFTDMEYAAQVRRIIDVNVTATTRLTHALLPRMTAKRRGSVVFLSSAGGGIVPSPMLSVYAATKSYIDALALALAGEVNRHGVVVQSLTPFFVVSEMSKVRRASWLVPAPEAFARKALDRHGYELRSNPHWAHELMASALVATRSLRGQVEYVARLHRGIRARALRKRERQEKRA